MHVCAFQVCMCGYSQWPEDSFRSPEAGLQVTKEAGLLLPGGHQGSYPAYQVQRQEPWHTEPSHMLLHW